jgi:hypothetical protein
LFFPPSVLVYGKNLSLLKAFKFSRSFLFKRCNYDEKCKVVGKTSDKLCWKLLMVFLKFVDPIKKVVYQKCNIGHENVNLFVQ